MNNFDDSLLAILGERGLVRGNDTEPYCHDWRGIHHGKARAVVRPSTTEEVSRIVALCALHGVPVVPQGGNTGLSGGAIPSMRGDELILLMNRLDKILEASPADSTLTVQAGVTLATAREAAAEMDLMFPLSIGSEGSAQIGGILSTNAGGSGTARYGNARDLALGLEVVLPDGQIWNGLRKLRKDNSGYCLRHLIMGAEGSLGIITAAVLKLVPAPRAIATAFCSLPSVQAALSLQQALKKRSGAELHCFEYMSRAGLEMVLRHIPNTRLPVEMTNHHILVELTSAVAEDGNTGLEDALAEMLEQGVIMDAAIATSETARCDFWRLRESFAEAQMREGAHIKCDVSVPVSQVSNFIDAVSSACATAFPGSSIVSLSHLGDGNVHCNVHCPKNSDPTAFLARSDEVSSLVDDIVTTFNGSFSAEHGIGCAKVREMELKKENVELHLMRLIKKSFDPACVMNPGKVLRALS